MTKTVDVGGSKYLNVMEVIITACTLIADMPYIGRKAYVNLETDTIFIEHKETDVHMTHDVDGKDMIPLYASSFAYRVLEENENA